MVLSGVLISAKVDLFLLNDPTYFKLSSGKDSSASLGRLVFGCNAPALLSALRALNGSDSVPSALYCSGE